jgi:tripartite-type tricarboxylate transporter receptor subunit TctC
MLTPQEKNMRLSLRSLLFSACMLAAAGAAAQAYPAKPVRLIVPFAPGGPADAGARIIVQKLTETTGMSMIIENRAGAGGTIGSDVVAKSAPDGYTLLLGSPGPLSIGPSLYPKLPYDPIKSFSPVILAISSAFVTVVHPSVPVKNVKQLVALARERPGQLRFGSAGNGSVLHLAGELFKTAAKVDLTHVPYKGGGPAMVDLLGGQIELMIVDIPLALPHVKSGKLRALAVTGRARNGLLPEVPTVSEAGVPGYEVSTWSGVLAPAETPADVVDKLQAAFAKALSYPDLKERFASQGVEVDALPRDQFSAVMREEIRKWGAVVRSAGAKID